MESNNAPSSFDYFGKTPKGVEMALHIDLATFDKVTPLAQHLRELDAALAAEGFTRSERLDKPARGGGGGGGAWSPKPQVSDPLPPGIDAPLHDGKPMLYKAEKEVFNCAEGSNCSDPREYQGKKYGKSMWLSEVRKKQAKAVVREDDFPGDEDF